MVVFQGTRQSEIICLLSLCLLGFYPCLLTPHSTIHEGFSWLLFLLRDRLPHNSLIHYWVQQEFLPPLRISQRYLIRSLLQTHWRLSATHFCEGASLYLIACLCQENTAVAFAASVEVIGSG